MEADSDMRLKMMIKCKCTQTNILNLLEYPIASWIFEVCYTALEEKFEELAI